MIPGLSGHYFEDIFFTEQDVTGVTRLAKCNASSNVQNTHIDKLKRQIAEQARKVGANAVVNFRYAQRATVFSFSSVTWDASGEAVFIPVDMSSSTSGAVNRTCPHCASDVSGSARFCRSCGQQI